MAKRGGMMDDVNSVMSAREKARSFLEQGKTVMAAGLMLKLIETQPDAENLTLLADIYMKQGLFDEAKALYLRVVKMGLNSLNENPHANGPSEHVNREHVSRIPLVRQQEPQRHGHVEKGSRSEEQNQRDVNKVCQDFCVNGQVLFLGWGAGEGCPFPRPSM
jgi:tetratricopeptide (TPR) repeat protein